MEQNGLFVGLIPDGNRRAVDYDTARYAQVYERGSDVVGDILRACVEDSRIRIFAAWGSSDDNILKRSQGERTVLNMIFHQYLDKLEQTLEEELYRGVQVVHLGNPEFVDPSVHRRICDVVKHTREREAKIFALCLGHGSHDEIQRAVRSWRNHPASDWTEHLDLPQRSGRPYAQVDLIVRTGTDPRTPYTSGFLLPYQGPGTQERYAADYLPDFSADRFIGIVDEATAQHKRLGA